MIWVNVINIHWLTGTGKSLKAKRLMSVLINWWQSVRIFDDKHNTPFMDMVAEWVKEWCDFIIIVTEEPISDARVTHILWENMATTIEEMEGLNK